MAMTSRECCLIPIEEFWRFVTLESEPSQDLWICGLRSGG
jgi:hypothetical protein